MFRSRLVIVIMLFISSVLTISGCSDKTNPGINPDIGELKKYFPLIEGSRYRYSDGIYTFEEIISTGFSDTAYITIVSQTGEFANKAVWSGSELSIINSTGTEISYLKFPYISGKDWQAFNWSNDRSISEGTNRIVSHDSLVTVPAGTFEAMVVRRADYNFNFSTEIARYDTFWIAFAKDIGMIFYHGEGQTGTELLEYDIPEEEE